MRATTAAAALLTVSLIVACGCVERRINIRSDPARTQVKLLGTDVKDARTWVEGAPVWVDEEYVGLTPVSYRFSHYGRRRIRVGPIREVAEQETSAGPDTPDGPVPPDETGRVVYGETERIVPIKPPWYEWFPIDFVSEVLIPFKIVDRHEVTFALRPVAADAMPTGQEAARQLIEEAEVFRKKALSPIPYDDE